MKDIISRANVNGAVKHVFNSPRFVNARKQEAGGFHKKSLFDNIWDSIKKFFDNDLKFVGKSIHITNHTDSSAYYIEIGIFLIIALIIIFIIVKILLKKEKVKLKLNVKHNDKIDFNTDYMKFAEEMIAKDNLKEATRYAFWSILVELNRLKALDIKDSKTNYQYIIEVRKKNIKDVKDFEKCVGIFNEIWYGSKEPSFDKFKECCDYYNVIASDRGRLK